MDELRLPTPPPFVPAPTYVLPPPAATPRFAAIEYPAPVHSLDAALESMGGIARIAATLDAEPDAATLPKPIELDFDPANRFAHPVPAHIAQGRNIVCRVVKRRRKVPARDKHGQVIEDGIYSIQPVGVQHKTVRFRAMADFQYTPDPHAGADPTMQLAEALTNMDVAGIRNFQFPAPTEEFPASAYLPPPAFTRHTLPQVFDLRPAAGTVQQVLDSGATRLISGTRHKARPMQSILFVQPDVPTGPEETLIKELGRTEPTPIEQRLLHLLQTRPVWTRTALNNQLSSQELKQSKADKTCWPMVAYTFGDGPFRDLIVRFGYDPRADPEARFFQHISLRNAANVRTRAQPGARGAAQAHAATARHAKAGTEDPLSMPSRSSHEFDGVHPHSKVANFQLIDLTDPLLSSLIHSPSGVLPTCSADGFEGWYAHDYLDQIRQVLRRKWLGALEGAPVSDEECADLLAWELSADSRVGRGRAGEEAESAGGKKTPAPAKRKGGAAKGKGKGKARARARSGSESTASETPSRGSDSPAAGAHDDDDEDKEEDEDEEDERGGSEAVSSGAESGTPTTGMARRSRETRRSTAAAVKAPWELPKRKRPKAKAAETEADLLARLSQQARKKSMRTAGESATPGPAPQ